MTAWTTASGQAQLNCWQCGGPARPDCTYRMKLVAQSSRRLDAFGFPVTRGRSLDTVRVPIPRCPRCRRRTNTAIVCAIAGALVGAIILPALKPWLVRHVPLPDWFASRQGVDSTAVALGATIGLVATMLGAAVLSRRWRLRSVMTYPYVIALRREGWYFPEGAS